MLPISIPGKSISTKQVTITDEKKLYTLDDMFSEFKMLKKQIEKTKNKER